MSVGLQLQSHEKLASYRVLHNFIRCQEPNDWLFNSVAEGKEELPDLDDQLDQQLDFPMEQTTSTLRDSIATSMWNNFINTWDEW
ncbi:hypothetical protein LIER_37504 [Lithospermum erythrorhizon]|uniref:Uncharacterized protein n=1 Tax=Lithospermum erythrorhizon TaxID=34254 RepID=A0AAV3PNM1_LITER